MTAKTNRDCRTISWYILAKGKELMVTGEMNDLYKVEFRYCGDKVTDLIKKEYVDVDSKVN